MKTGFAIGAVVSKSNSLSPQQKRKHKHAWRQSQHHPKNHGLNRRHRRPHAFDFADPVGPHPGHAWCVSCR